MEENEKTHQQHFSLASYFKNNQSITIHETSSLELFKSLIAFPHPESTEYYTNEARVVTTSKLIGSLKEDIRLKINPSITLIYEQSSLEGFHSPIHGFRNFSTTIEFDASVMLVLRELMPYLNGDYTVKEIANIYETSETEIRYTLQPLYEIGFLVLCSKSLVPASSFYAHLISIERARRVEKISPINMDNKENLKEILIHNLLALYHFAESFPDHLSAAISQTTNFNLKEQLCSTLSESYWYSNMLLKGLMELGYSKEQLKRLTPCPATLGVINYLRWLAKVDLLSYAACLGILEYPEVSTQQSYDIFSFIQNKWEQIEALSLVPKEALEPFREQQKLEFLSKRAHLSKYFFEVESYLTPERQEEIRNHVLVFIQCLQAETAYITGEFE
ncbi:MAG: hypothetical protein J0H12_06930 [Candidatus Paracaedimonas acanthamoebae]|uniref:Uncharacterized protein n=1 Tax=Candidatus Paracaedimonas acanthamoebae TaxID=244581 RepID=A0A8J7TTR3_9PROT|nr:hypothetical protein [Candidatus Paracaedimonas acanthamoebae]